MDQSGRDTYLKQVPVGGLERRAIMIVDYDANWPVRFVAHRDRVARALGPVARSIEHIGCTAVPGLAAKPIIGHRMFRTSERDVHVHVWQDSDPEITRYLKVRDRLRASVRDRQAAEHRGRELANANATANAKSQLIEQILSHAADDYRPFPPADAQWTAEAIVRAGGGVIGSRSA